LIEKIPPVDPRCLGEREQTGAVKLAIVVGKDGRVIDVEPLTGPESLISAAVDAVSRWRYKPTLLNGRPVEMETTVDVGFPPAR
jgi:periplasmic protein TonB